MISQKTLAELRTFNRTMHSETDWTHFFHSNFTQLLDTIDELWKENAELKWCAGVNADEHAQYDDSLKKHMAKLEAVAKAAEMSLPSKDLFEPHEGIKRLREALAALKDTTQ